MYPENTYRKRFRRLKTKRLKPTAQNGISAQGLPACLHTHTVFSPGFRRLRFMSLLSYHVSWVIRSAVSCSSAKSPARLPNAPRQPFTACHAPCSSLPLPPSAPVSVRMPPAKPVYRRPAGLHLFIYAHPASPAIPQAGQ